MTGVRNLCWILLLTAATAAAEPPPSLEQRIVAEINRARTQPSALIPQLESFRMQFEGKYYRKPGSPVRMTTREGTAAVDEAIAFLRRQPPLAPLQWADGLAAAARELVTEQQASGTLGHGQGRWGMEERIERHGDWTIGYAENVAYGDFRTEDAAEIVQQLIIDDGVPGRGHRLNFFAPDYRLAAAACGPHPRQQSVCVIDLAGGRREEAPEP